MEKTQSRRHHEQGHLEHLGGQFQLERTDVIATPNATHLRFSVIR